MIRFLTTNHYKPKNSGCQTTCEDYFRKFVYQKSFIPYAVATFDWIGMVQSLLVLHISVQNNLATANNSTVE